MVAILLAIDLGIFQRRPHAIRSKEALLLTLFWIALALAFNLFVLFWRGRGDALKFLSGYVLEYSLSVDNLFVFLVIFSYFGVPQEYRPKALFWGILGALVTRGIFIFLGVSLIHIYHWFYEVFGAILILTALKFAFSGEKQVEPEKNLFLKIFRRYFPVTESFEDEKFFLVRNGRRYATPLLCVLLVIETTDIFFAFDSVPAVFSVSLDPFIVYSSNIFAILGLRSLFFAISDSMEIFHYLDKGVSLVLLFIGAKMLLSNFYEIPVGISLAVVGSILLLSIAASLLFPSKKSE